MTREEFLKRGEAREDYTRPELGRVRVVPGACASFKAESGVLLSFFNIATGNVFPRLKLDSGVVVAVEDEDLEILEFVDDAPPIHVPADAGDGPAKPTGYKVSVRRSKRMADGKPLEEVSEVQFIEADDYMVKGRFLLFTKGSELVAVVSDRYLEYVLR